MSDSRPEDEAERPAQPEPEPEPHLADASGAEPAARVEPSTAESPAVERRAFLRQLTGEAVVTSARLAGLSTAVRRGLFAAAESATRDKEPTGGEPESVEASGVPPAPPVPPQPAAPLAPVTPVAPAAATPAVPLATPVALSPRQEALLATATSAVLGTNDAAGAPHLTSSRFHWDGTVVRLPSDLFAARVERIDADARVSLLVAAEGPDIWVAINGTATVVTGDAVEAAMMEILRKDMTDEEAARSWTEMRSAGNPVVIEVRPSRYLWRLG